MTPHGEKQSRRVSAILPTRPKAAITMLPEISRGGSVRVPVAVVRVPVSVEVLVVRVLDPLSNQQQVGWQPTG